MTNKLDCITVGDLQTNCWLYLLEEGSGQRTCAIIDPGDEADAIVSGLRELNWIPLYILLTHGHIDHVAALPDLLAAFKNSYAGSIPKIGIHRLDSHYLGKDSLKVHQESFTATGGSPAFVNALWKALPNADIYFAEGDTIGPFTVLHVPGHSPGSVGFYDEKAGLLFSGDTLFRGTWGRTDLPGGNTIQMRQSLTRLLSMKGEIVVCPGHGSATTIKEETGLLREL